jgi:hypothetical protein
MRFSSSSGVSCLSKASFADQRSWPVHRNAITCNEQNNDGAVLRGGDVECKKGERGQDKNLENHACAEREFLI